VVTTVTGEAQCLDQSNSPIAWIINHNYRAWLNRIDRKSADFVICAKDLQPLLVIELDDATHASVVQKKRDADKDAAFNAAQIRVERVHVKALRTMIAAEALPVGAAAPATAAGGTESIAARRDGLPAARASRSRHESV
jgi:hypothetical protein